MCLSRSFWQIRKHHSSRSNKRRQKILTKLYYLLFCSTAPLVQLQNAQADPNNSGFINCWMTKKHCFQFNCADIFSTTIMSLERSLSSMYPSRCFTPKSPLINHPPLYASCFPSTPDIH